jgi:hypothetical protein
MPSGRSKKAKRIEWTHQLLFCTNVVCLLGENVNFIKRTLEAVLDASKVVGLEVTELERCNLYWHTRVLCKF